MLSVIVNLLKSVILSVIASFKRALCCFRRRRRLSTDFEPLTQVGVVPSQSDPISYKEQSSWNDWGSQFVKPRTIQDHIDLYRQHKVAAKQKHDESEESKDFFEDMTPTLTKQEKIIIQTDNKTNLNTNRLSLAPENVVGSSELEEWEDSGGWEDETLDWDAQEALRQKRRLEREKRAWEQYQKRHDKTVRSTPLGAKVSP